MKILWIILVGLWLLHEAECGRTIQKHLVSRKYGRGRAARNYRVTRQPLCEHGSCYPAVGNLLTGRARQLHASSTCGLHEPQKYCVMSDLNNNKCYICNSRRHNVDTSHRIHNVVPSFSSGPVRTWWQSENGVQEVSIRLDLEAEFHITHMIITFKTFRPAAAVIERSVNLGRTWQPYRYFAYDCANAFPGIPVRQQLWVGDVVCESRYSAIEPSSNGELIFKVLDPRLPIMDPYSQRIQDLLRVTNLRVNFTRLHTLGDNLLHPRTKVQQKYYYAVYEMVVHGNCFCYGHASQCIPIKPTEVMVPGKVHGRCLCTHNTAGTNCERCKNFHMDTPWAPTRDRHARACKRCNCNGHSGKCSFDMAVFIASGNVSGGVCDDCQHNMAGHHCQLCRPFYYRHPRRNVRSHDACVPCNCDKRGTKNGGHCDGLKDPTLRQIGGGCHCKANVEGVQCDRCKPGHFGLDTNNPLGCHPCGCDPRGTVSGTAACDPLTGSCTCKRMVTGHRCHQCQKGHWGLSFAEPNGCHPCTCDFGGAYDEMCNPVDGQCRCRPHMQGKSCTHPAPGYFCMETFLNIYEAEAAHLVHSSANTVTVVRRRRRIGQEVTWTGSGFIKMHDGTGLEFSISDISHSMHYNVVIRYELKTLERWRAELMILGWSTDVLSSECESFNPLAYKQEVKLHKNSRNVAFPEAVCLKKGVIYTVRIHLWFEGLINPRPSTTLLIDSVVLRPSMSNVLPHGEASLRAGMLGCLLSPLQRLQRMPHHNCTQILCSISAVIHDGAIPCACNRFGSKNDICEAIGGQCPCHPMIIGRKCDTCTPQTYGHRPGSCMPCRCDPRGSVKEVCDAQTGQCECHVGKAGLRCDTCEPGRWDYPRCLLCNCRGRADHCDADTGFCLNCRRNSTGRHCENCLDGYYEDPSVGTGCIQCPCPGHPRNRVNAYSCHRHRVTQHMVCQCLPAYRGKKCELCAVGHYGHPLSPHSDCKPCDCSGNADMMAKDACHPQTGECLKCLHNSAGPHCAVCRDGYYGNASLQLCKECQCNTLGTTPEACSLSTGLCRCQHITGKCSCLPGVHGHTCSQCNRGYWGLHSGGGCKPCRCNPTRSLGTRCHPDTGQCHCFHGYGGLTCASCQEDHWGSAYTYCLPCNCSQWGVATSGRICKASTGHCLCRNGSTGQRCEKCMRGYHREHGRPCKECHVCFKLWNKAVSELLTEAAELFSRPLDLCMGNSSWNGELDEVERIIDEVRGIMETLPDLNSPVHDFQKRISQTGRKVEVLFRTLSTSHSEVEDIDRWLKHTLVEVASIGRETIKLDRMLQEITEQKDNLPDATSTSAPDIVISYIKDIKEAHAKSTKAEEQAIQATTGPRSPIRRSESIRKQTTNVLENALKIQQNNTNILKNMSTIVNNLGVENLSRKVCGSNMNESCDEARSCGGTLCKESHGWWCGGDKCKGLAQLSKNTLNDANAASVTVAELFKNLSRQLSQVEKVKKNASDAKSIANKAILRAFDAVEIVQNASGGIDDILQRYNDFSIGVDPLEVEDLALKTLNITLPVSDAEINKLIVQIMSALEALNKMDMKLTLEEVQDMSKKAQDARIQALKTNSEVQKAKRTLTDVDIIQKDTKQKMDVANDRVKKSSEELEQAKLQMRAVKLNVSETGDRLARLGAAVKQLQLKTNTITATVEEIKEDVNHSSQDAQRVYQNLQTVSLSIDNLQEKYVDKANVSALINGRIGDIVEKLANITDVQNMLQKIEDQKKKISEQREVMQDRQKQIENMNKEVKGYKKKIDDVIIKYNHCALLRRPPSLPIGCASRQPRRPPADSNSL